MLNMVTLPLLLLLCTILTCVGETRCDTYRQGLQRTVLLTPLQFMMAICFFLMFNLWSLVTTDQSRTHEHLHPMTSLPWQLGACSRRHPGNVCEL